MRKSWLMCVLLGALAWGQAAPSAASRRAPQRRPAGAMTVRLGSAECGRHHRGLGHVAAKPATAAAKGTAAKPPPRLRRRRRRLPQPIAKR